MMKNAIVDLVEALRRADLWLFLGWHDVRQRYRRSTLGPFWITLAMMIFVGLMTVVYSALFGQDPRTFLPLVAAGLVLWTLISTCLIEGSTVFINASSTIRQIPAPLPVHVFRLLWQQVIYFGHNIIVVVLVVMFTESPINANVLLFVPAMLLIAVNLGWIVLLLGCLGARYRDVPTIVQAFSSALFMATPVMWAITFLPPERRWVAYLNPFTYLIEIARVPLLGTAPSAQLWCAPIGMALVGWLLAVFVYGRSRSRLAYWL
jgi:ABC-type polysaccharide/polyol phosphate export permease